ncbi:hypothetical protein MP638_000248 [Amoeboaphelidium occidentale]|nr:hypothetical protein MP638_000248 [Amoeboaphelidium occidentale]
MRSLLLSSNVELPSFIRPSTFENLPRLHHGLERVLFNPGVHYLKDPRTNWYNYKRYLQRIVQPSKFNYDLLPQFTPPSQDTTLSELATEHNAKFVGSTSSTTAALSQIYFAVSGLKNIPTENYPKEFHNESSRFTKYARSAAVLMVAPQGQNGVYSIDQDSFGQEKRGSIMMELGKSMEIFLTSSKEEFSWLLKKDYDSKADANKDKERQAFMERVKNAQGVYSYCKSGSLLIRSQLDCYHPALPNKAFDLKTRATVAIRRNANEHRLFLNYKLDNIPKFWRSYAREIYDMSRSTLIKYHFQVRLGSMDGLFIAYHNTDQVFGFQYMSREEIDDSLFGGGSGCFGDKSFNLCTRMLDLILSNCAKKFGQTKFRLLMRTTHSNIDVFGEKISDDQELSEPPKDQSMVAKWRYHVRRLLNDEYMTPETSLELSESDNFEIYVDETAECYTEEVFNEYVIARNSAISLIIKDETEEERQKRIAMNKRLFLTKR